MTLPILIAAAIGPIDAAIVVVYVVASTLLGIWLGRGQTGQRDYFLGGKQLPTWALLLSIVSTETSTVTFLSVPGLSFVEGGDFRFLQIAFGYIVGRLAIVALLLPHYFRGEMLTAYQVLEQRFGLATRRLASLVFLVTRSIADGLRLFLTALALHVAVGVPILWSIALLSIAIGLYSCFGGVRSIVWNDCLQFVVYMIGAIVAAVLLVWRIPGGWTQLMEFAESTGRLRLFDFDPSLTKPGITFWSGLIGGAFLSLASHGTDQMIVQRYLCARDRGAASWALASSGFVVFFQFALFLFIGLELACYYSLNGTASTLRGDEAFMTFIAHDLETGLSGLLLAGAFAAAISSSLNSLASSLMSDWMGPRLALWGERKSLAVARWLTIFFAVVQCVVAIGVYHLAVEQAVVDSVLKIAGFATGLILGLYGLGLIAPRTSQTVAIAAFFTGVVVMFSVAFGTQLNGYWYALVGSSSIVLAGVIYQAVGNLFRPREVALVLAFVLASAGGATAAELGAQTENRIDAAVEQYLKRGEMAGCVVVIGRTDGVLFEKAYGDRQMEPEAVPMSLDTLFDMASLTKPIATGTSVMLLVERGELRLSDKVAQFFPEFAEHDKGEVTVEQLLVHSGGLIPDNSLDDYDDGWKSALPKICDLKPLSPPGKKFKYSDVGFILLGKIVEQVSGKPVNEFVKEEVFAKIGMKESGYLPADELKQRAVATEQRGGEWLRGVVHDPRAAQMGGVAGHAGLFSTAHDLVRYAQMMLRGGELDGVRVLGAATVAEMTRPRRIAGNKRGLGWDMGSEYSRNRGETMSPRAFGHGGFTGTAMWIDPKLDLFVIFLSTRLHPDGIGEVNSLAGRIGTIAAGAVSGERDQEADTGRLSGQSVGDVKLGIDVLKERGFDVLRGKRVALITNHTGMNSDGVSTAKLLHDAKDVKLVALFSPEHGFAGALDVNHIGDTRHEELDVPIYSLYGKSRKPTREQLAEIDVLVYDIQDIGARFYTYISTLGMGLEAATEAGIEYVVLDRPNPIDGVSIEGPLRDKDDESFVAYHTLPVRHGMTVGELARMFAAERKLDGKLTVVPAEGWQRSQSWHDTGLTWINPSPNMRSETAALLYPGIGLLETTNVSVGRGTDAPFEVLGAPWIDERALAAAVNRANPPGVRVAPVRFTPTGSKFAGEECGGLNFVITDWDACEPFELGMIVARELRKLHPKDWDTKSYNRLLTNDAVYQAVISGETVRAILDSVEPQVQQFRARREPYLLYR